MRRAVRLIVAMLTLAGPAQAQEAYGFVARLGRDTTSIEWIVRTGNRVVSNLVEQSPRVFKRHWEATLAPDGTVQRWSMDMHVLNPLPGRPALYTYDAKFGADSVRTVTRSGDEVRTAAIRRDGTIAMPWDSFVYDAYELIFAAALKQPGETVSSAPSWLCFPSR